ncbi:RNA 2',3'-cyclic phosphodiesterase [Candidatus Wolfebacteria bacterium]|nr:RNA 2',3'-cyclic phosphodiesterase [Candidatus Wolfebacteria bacterium]
MKRRVFIAINLSERAKDKIEQKIETIRGSFTDNIRFIDRKNWHITLSFLGYQEDESIGEIVGTMEKIIPGIEQPEINFTDIDYGPKGKTPRMIWLNGDEETSKILGDIRNSIEEELADREVVFNKDNRKFSTHITLAKLRSSKDLPDIKTNLGINFLAGEAVLMESHLSQKGSNYEVLQASEFEL